MSASVTTSRAVACDYCTRPAELVHGDTIYPHRPDLAKHNFWYCGPCQAWVGCHNGAHGGKTPLGRLANATLRAAKGRAHAAFDPIWKSRRMSRTDAYAWLSKALGLPARETHIGMFDVAMCNRVVAIMEQLK